MKLKNQIYIKEDIALKRFLSIFLTIALIVTLAPQAFIAPTANAAGIFFLFPNESDNPSSPRIVSSSNVTLEGTLNNVIGSTVSYKVEQLAGGAVVNRTEEITTGIHAPASDNRITVNNVPLFSGLNRITFSGVSSAATVSESIYIEYRNSPMLYDLAVNFENNQYVLPETDTLMLHTSSPVPVETGNIVITGKAPNAQRVTVVLNGQSYEFTVQNINGEFRFSTSSLTIRQGINNIVLKVQNNGQTIETTRQVAFYNGRVTIYDLKLQETGNGPTHILDPMANLSVTSNTTPLIHGKVILPLPLKDLGSNPDSPNANPGDIPVADIETEIENMLFMNLKQGAGATTRYNVTSVTVDPSPVLDSTKFITASFTFTLPTLTFDTQNQISFLVPNGLQYYESNWNYFTLRDSTKAYIYDINYLSGYNENVTDSQLLNLQGTDIPSGGADVYSMPMAVEVLIGNHNSLGSLVDLIDIAPKSPTTGTVDWEQRTPTEVVYRTVNGQQVPFLRMFVVLSKLPSSGTNHLSFSLDNASAASGTTDVTFKLLYGPFVKFDTLVENMAVEYDDRSDNANTMLAKLGGLKGQLLNIPNVDEIIYKQDVDSASGTPPKQTVFLYLNNVEIPLAQDGTKTRFVPVDHVSGGVTTPASQYIFNLMLKAGDNTLKFVFRSDTSSYENTFRFTVMPKNLPVIPAPNTLGVFPYSASSDAPRPNDPNFVYQNGIYTTKEAQLKAYGTFDFIDLGADAGSIISQLNSLNGTADDRKKYKVRISSPNWKVPVEWDLSKLFTLSTNGVPDLSTTFNDTPEGREGLNTSERIVDFYYETTDQTFYFIISGQQMPLDGSPQVYTITVFNDGDNGPRASFRLEVKAISIPYTIYSPLPEERTLNQNYVEVIISSPGADSMTIGKETAKKVTYIDYNGTNGPIQVEAFRAVVKNLGANKVTSIPITIVRGQESIKETLSVNYRPANIPGAQFMQTMSAKHKAFNNAVELSFPRNTQLIRPTYNLPENLQGQVYNGHDILFAIANAEDGIVNRHDFKGQPANYTAENKQAGEFYIKYLFQDQARQFIQVSPMFWIDAGLADDPSTDTEFDSVPIGLDPFPFPNIEGNTTLRFNERESKIGLQLVPSNAGSLTLAYDPNMAQSAGTTVTVFRYDPFTARWENIGGVVDEKKRTITVPFTKFGYYVAVKLTRGFNDMVDHPYAKEAMEAVYAKGVMNAVDNSGRFGTDEYITRGEFARMIVRALDWDLNYSGQLFFSYYPQTITNANQPTSLYDYRYIETAARRGIVEGTRPGFFEEDGHLTREQAATILSRALGMKTESNSAKAKANLDKIFKDSGQVSFYAVPHILAIQKKGFVQGMLINPNNPKEGSVFAPKSRLLRADAAIIIANVMNDLKKLPKIYN